MSAYSRDAARALTIRDLISTNGYTQAHYDLLTGPWRQVMGPLHADDDRPAATGAFCPEVSA